jgi:C4-dicarboxylate-specific signal transduction histidine kinase
MTLEKKEDPKESILNQGRRASHSYSSADLKQILELEENISSDHITSIICLMKIYLLDLNKKVKAAEDKENMLNKKIDSQKERYGTIMVNKVSLIELRIVMLTSQVSELTAKEELLIEEQMELKNEKKNLEMELEERKKELKEQEAHFKEQIEVPEKFKFLILMLFLLEYGETVV